MIALFLSSLALGILVGVGIAKVHSWKKTIRYVEKRKAHLIETGEISA